MRSFLRWLTAPHVAPLLARLVLVALTALTAPEVVPELPPEGLAASVGALLEWHANRR